MTSRREIIERVTEHLREQGEKSFWGDDDALCAYRGTNGLKCAVGCLITDEAYTPELEGEGVRDEKVIAALEASGIKCTPSIVVLLNVLQEIHDYVAPKDWAKELERVK